MKRTYTQEEVERIITASNRYSTLRRYGPSDPLNLPYRNRFNSCLETAVQSIKETLQTIEKYPEFFSTDAAEVALRAHCYLGSMVNQQPKLAGHFTQNILENKETGTLYNNKKLKI